MTDLGLSASGMLLSGESEAGGGHGRFFVGQTSGEIIRRRQRQASNVKYYKPTIYDHVAQAMEQKGNF